MNIFLPFFLLIIVGQLLRSRDICVCLYYYDPIYSFLVNWDLGW